jgi:hypothetical protein
MVDSGLKRFKDEESAVLYDIAQGNKEITIDNFSLIKRQLLSDTEIVRYKDELILQSARIVDNLYPDFLSQNQLRILQKEPLEFKISKNRGDIRMETVEETMKNHALKVNTIGFFYKVQQKIINFLIDRDNNLMENYNRLRTRFLELEKENSLMKNELEAFRIIEQKPLLEQQESELILAPEELQELDFEMHKEQSEQQSIDEEEPVIQEKPRKKTMLENLKNIKLFKKQNKNESKTIINNVDVDFVEDTFNEMDKK